MASFSIDDVRETLTTDITGFLTRIEETAVSIAGRQLTDDRASGGPFRLIEEAGHAVYGTSALVSADSLATSARMLEGLAERGQHELLLALSHAEEARKIAELVRDGAAEMRTMLDLELEHRGDDAQWIALDWQDRANALLGAAKTVEAVTRASLAPPSPAAESPAAEGEQPIVIDDSAFEAVEGAFAFDAPDGALSGNDGIHDELAVVFQQEARECLVALEGHLAALFADPNDLGSARSLERLYHTLKGAAATVGLARVSDDAHELQERMQSVVERGASVTTTLLEELVAGTQALLSSAGLSNAMSGFTASKVADARPGPARGAQSDFAMEIAKAFADASALLEKLGEGAGTEDARGELARIFHRVEGSALVVGDDAIAVESARLQTVCESADASTAELSRGLSRIAQLAGIRAEHAPKSTRAPSSSALTDDEARAAFVEEARQICDEAADLADRLDGGSETSAAADAASELERLFHRMKGSALVVGETAVHEEAARLERACRGDSAEGLSTTSLREDIARIRAALGVTGSIAAPKDLGPERHAVAPVDSELWQAFTQECGELLESIDRTALDLEESDTPKKELTALLPLMHTLKGVVNTMGLALTGKALHRVEDLLEELLEAPILPSMRAVATFLLQVQVEVRRNLKQAGKGYVELSLAKLEVQIARVKGGRKARPASGASRDSAASAGGESEGSEASVAKGSGSATGALDRKFVRVGTDRLDALMNLAGELVVSRSRLLSRVDGLRMLQTELGRGGRRLIDTVDKFCDEHEFSRIDGGARPLAMAAGAESMSSVVSLRNEAPAPANDAAWSGFGELELDRYEDVHILSRSLTELTSDFGEMYGQLSQRLAALTDDADAFGGIVTGIQSEVTRARMVPLDVLFSRLRLPVRDAAVREDKDVRVVTRGEEVQLDKTIADALFQPMLHLVRNAVAHGLERADRREASGKPKTGTIELSARQELGQIVLEVRDDGGGLNLARLRAQGIAMGLIASDAAEDDPGIKDLVFAPGLSTETSARDVAGRGVGCDVVRRAVERLNGSIRVESEPGSHTSFVLTLPLTLAITKALLVEHAAQPFAVPLYFAERILDAEEHTVVESAGHYRVRLDDQWTPVQRLGSFLGEAARGARSGPIVVLRVGTERVLVQVDAVIGQEEIVVKNLGSVLTGHPLFAGVTLRGTGEMCLILDVPGLMESRTTTRAIVAPKPIAAADEQPRIDPRPAPAAPRVVAPLPDAQPSRLRVMFVDDSLSVRKVAERALAALDVDVTTAVDGLDALEKMRAQTFDLVFTDLEMPRMHGFELIRELRFLTAYQDLPIVVVTSRSGQKHQEQARALGANEYMTKPFTAQSLSAAIEKWGRGRARKESGT